MNRFLAWCDASVPAKKVPYISYVIFDSLTLEAERFVAKLPTRESVVKIETLALYYLFGRLAKLEIFDCAIRSDCKNSVFNVLTKKPYVLNNIGLEITFDGVFNPEDFSKLQKNTTWKSRKLNLAHDLFEEKKNVIRLTDQYTSFDDKVLGFDKPFQNNHKLSRNQTKKALFALHSGTNPINQIPDLNFKKEIIQKKIKNQKNNQPKNPASTQPKKIKRKTPAASINDADLVSYPKIAFYTADGLVYCDDTVLNLLAKKIKNGKNTTFFEFLQEKFNKSSTSIENNKKVFQTGKLRLEVEGDLLIGYSMDSRPTDLIHLSTNLDKFQPLTLKDSYPLNNLKKISIPQTPLKITEKIFNRFHRMNQSKTLPEFIQEMLTNGVTHTQNQFTVLVKRRFHLIIKDDVIVDLQILNSSYTLKQLV